MIIPLEKSCTIVIRFKEFVRKQVINGQEVMVHPARKNWHFC